MRKQWDTLGAWLIKIFGWAAPVREIKLDYAVKTQFRGLKNVLGILEWQNIAQIFVTCPDFEDLIQIKLKEMEDALRSVSVGPEGDRLRLVNDSQREILNFFATLPDYGAGRVQEMLKAKKVPSLKGNEHAHP